MALPIHEKSGMANATPAIPLLPPLENIETLDATAFQTDHALQKEMIF